MSNRLSPVTLHDLIATEISSLEVTFKRWLTSENFDDFLKLTECAKRILSSKTNKIVFFGNGGSAAEASHISAEFVSKCVTDTGAKPSISLNDNLSVITAVANDFGYEEVFSRQIDSICMEGDLVIGLSTSGSSPNVLKGLRSANHKGCFTSLWTSQKHSPNLFSFVDWIISAPSDSTPRTQEFHLFLGHIMSEYIENEKRL
jgi:D-sedoheptulose 7-phosphate isomerase